MVSTFKYGTDNRTTYNMISACFRKSSCRRAYREDAPLGVEQVASAALFPLKRGEVLDDRLTFGPLILEDFAPFSRPLNDHNLL